MHRMPELRELVRLLMMTERERQEEAAHMVRQKLAKWREAGRVEPRW